ncbi:MAG: YggT family protein [Pararhodobacter sp.]
MLSLLQIVYLILDVLWFIVIVHVVLSWLINFNVLNLRQPLVAQIWDGLNRLLEPIYSRIRAFLPDMGGIDLSPLILLVGLYAIRIVIANNIQALI